MAWWNYDWDPLCHWCFDHVAEEDEVGDGKDYIAHAECHEIQT